jgi:signal transduction histidine kinase
MPPPGGLSSAMKPAIRKAVRAARLAYVFNGQPLSLLIATVLATITAVVVRQAVAPWRVVAWYVAFIAVGCARLALYRSYQRAMAQRAKLDLDRFERRFLTGTLAAGVAWGSVCILMFPSDPTLQVFLAFVLAGTAAGAVTTLSADRHAAFGFVLLSVIPLCVRLVLLGTTLSTAMSLMVAAFLVIVSSSIDRLHAQIVDLVTARVDADSHLSELQAAQADVQALNGRLTMATEAAKLGVWEWDLRNNQLLWDARMYEIYALPHDVTPDYDSHRRRIHPHDVARLDAGLYALRSGVREFAEEFRILWPDGTERFIRTAAKIQHDHTGREQRIVGVNWDITDVKRLERLKSEFVSIVSHELRTPLTSIRGSLGLIAGGTAGQIPEKAQQLVRMADRNAERLAALIDDLLDMDKIESGRLVLNLQAQPLMPLIEQAVDANAGYAHMRKVDLKIESRCDATIQVDTLRFLQVMANLLSNAAKFSPPESHVSIAATRVERRVRVEVSDLGPGISPEFQDQIFSKFAQGDSSDARAKGGTGLGLAISKALIEQMHGSIGYRVQTPRGTKFFIELPEFEEA